MRVRHIARRAIAALLAGAIALTGCTTAQLQKRYTSFDACFRDQKVLATAGGAILGAVVGNAIGGGGRKGAGVAAIGAVLGGVIGNRVAWQACMDAFPVRAQTQLLTPLPQAQPVRPGAPAAPAAAAPARGLVIQNVVAQPLQFGRDLEVAATYSLNVDRPGAKDIKARVWRNLLFTGPDGTRHEVTSSSEEVLQLGVSRSNFALPTPSLQDAPELPSTRDWVFKLIVEADGMRQEQAIALVVPQLEGATQAQQGPAVVPTAAQMPAPAAARGADPAGQTIGLRANTVLVAAPGSSTVVARLAAAASVRVLRRTVERGFNWLEVRLPDGRAGWVRGGAAR